MKTRRRTGRVIIGLLLAVILAVTMVPETVKAVVYDHDHNQLGWHYFQNSSEASGYANSPVNWDSTTHHGKTPACTVCSATNINNVVTIEAHSFNDNGTCTLCKYRPEHKVTVNYTVPTGYTAPEPTVVTGTQMTTHEVFPPEITGIRIPGLIVSSGGDYFHVQIGSEDTTITKVYELVSYTLKVDYVIPDVIAVYRPENFKDSEIIEDLHHKDHYRVESPTYNDLVPDIKIVEGNLNGADANASDYVHVRVTYHQPCVDGRVEHETEIVHDSTVRSHATKCKYCYKTIDETANAVRVLEKTTDRQNHYLYCDVCAKIIGDEPCTIDPAEVYLATENSCRGKCLYCKDEISYGQYHDYGDYTHDAATGKHSRTCKRCGYVETKDCEYTKYVRQGVGEGGKHKKQCKVCGGEEPDWTDCSFECKPNGKGYHHEVCECGNEKSKGRCKYELTTDVVYHHYTCSECEQHWQASHTASSWKRENYQRPTIIDEGHYDKVKYCSKCGYEMERHTYSLQPRTWDKKSGKIKLHFSGGGGAKVRRTKTEMESQVEHIRLEPLNFTDGLDEYFDEHFEELVEPFSEQLEAYFTAHPERMGTGWRIDLQPWVRISVNSYSESMHRMNTEINARYQVYVTNDADVNDMIGFYENLDYRDLAVNFPITMRMEVPLGIGEEGSTIYIQNNHNGVLYNYVGTVSVEEGIAWCEFTSKFGLSPFEFRMTPFETGSDGSSITSEAEEFTTSDGKTVSVAATGIIPVSTVEYTGGKITAESLGAAVDTSSLISAAGEMIKTGDAKDLFKVTWVVKNNKNAGTAQYYAKVTFNEKKAKKYKMSTDDISAMKAAVKKINDSFQQYKQEVVISPVKLDSFVQDESLTTKKKLVFKNSDGNKLTVTLKKSGKKMVVKSVKAKIGTKNVTLDKKQISKTVAKNEDGTYTVTITGKNKNFAEGASGTTK